MATVKTFYFNELRECTYVVWDDTCECVIIDPGCGSATEFSRLRDFVTTQGLKPVRILLTHGHFDHILGLENAAREWGLSVHVSDSDHCQIELADKYCSMLGLEFRKVTADLVDISDGDRITFGKTVFEVIATPGHTKGGVCYYCSDDGILFSGDTLFAGSIGRTDHVDGNYDELMESLNGKIAKLPPEVAVFPGHGPSTTIGYELKNNPFLKQ